jgi:hypothetical protein
MPPATSPAAGATKTGSSSVDPNHSTFSASASRNRAIARLPNDSCTTAPTRRVMNGRTLATPPGAAARSPDETVAPPSTKGTILARATTSPESTTWP